MSSQSRNLTAIFYFIQDLYHVLPVSQSYCHILLYTRSLSCPLSLLIFLPYFTLYKIFIMSSQSLTLTAIFYFIQDLYHVLSVSKSYIHILFLSCPLNLEILHPYFIFIMSSQSRNLTSIFYFYHVRSISKSYRHNCVCCCREVFHFTFFSQKKIFFVKF